MITIHAPAFYAICIIAVVSTTWMLIDSAVSLIERKMRNGDKR